MGNFVNPFTDMGFKIIFGSELSKDMLIIFLNELLRGEQEIEDLTFLDKEDHGDNMRDKGIIYDIYCRTTDGKYIIVEMQNRKHSNFLNRTLYYVCRSIGRQAGRPFLNEADVHSSGNYGDRYKLSAVYGIFLMNFKEKDLEDKFRTDTVITDRETGLVINTNFRQIYLQFPLFTKELKDCETLFERMIYTLKHMDKWDRMPDALKDQVFQRLAQLASVAHLSEADQIAYDKALDRYYVEQTVRHDEYMEGMEKGIQKVAIQMLNDGLSLDTISRYTGLTEAEIATLN